MNTKAKNSPMARPKVAALILMVGSLGVVQQSAWSSKESSSKESGAAGGPPVVRRLTESEYRATVADIFAPDIPVVGRFERELRIDGLIAIGTSEAGMSAFSVEQYDASARGIAAVVVSKERRDKLVPCQPKAETDFDKACAKQVVEHYGPLLFRRLDVIVVTARRIAENLMDVPQTVNAVSGTQLQEYNILKFEDLSQLVPGLDLRSDNSGFRATASVRGVNFDVSSQGTPTVEMYFNEVPMEPGLVFQGNFDIGQIEVLRGPQGTLRGRSAPSGSIVQMTRRPDLVEFGSYASTTVTDLGGINVQGAVGLPIVEDKLAVRLAALYDYNDAGGAESIFNEKDPRSKTQGIRGSLRFEPTDSISSLLTYQHLIREGYDYGAIRFGTGTTGGSTPATTTLPAVDAPANFNGPPLEGKDRKSIQEFPRHIEQDIDMATLQADWAFASQKLSYVGGYSAIDLAAAGDSDSSNTILGRIGPMEDIDSFSDRWTHELRLSSDERVAGLFDCTVGGFYGKYYAHTKLNRPDTLIVAGAFGSPLGSAAPGGPGTLSPSTYDSRYAHDPDRWGPHRFERIGEVFFVPPREALHARSEPGSQTSMVCQINPDLIEKWFDGELQWTEWRLKAGLHVSDLSIRGLLMRLTREVCHPGFASGMLLDLIVPQLAIELGRYCASIQEGRPKSGLAAWRLRLIDERVRELGKAPLLSELAELCHLSVRQLSRGFRISRDCCSPMSRRIGFFSSEGADAI